MKAAAVADYRPRLRAEQKIKRTGPITIELEPTSDILAEVMKVRQPGTLVIGFAAETENPLEHARDKLARKGVDAIVVNDVSREGDTPEKSRVVIRQLGHATGSSVNSGVKLEFALLAFFLVFLLGSSITLFVGRLRRGWDAGPEPPRQSRPAVGSEWAR